ncbi:MAG: hypothetical protein AVDCRST_MAG39-2652, partial [uncultured Sphingomonadaceae bacterium]
AQLYSAEHQVSSFPGRQDVPEQDNPADAGYSTGAFGPQPKQSTFPSLLAIQLAHDRAQV